MGYTLPQKVETRRASLLEGLNKLGRGRLAGDTFSIACGNCPFRRQGCHYQTWMGRSAGNLAFNLKGPDGKKSRDNMRRVLNSNVEIDFLPCYEMIDGVAAARKYVAEAALAQSSSDSGQYDYRMAAAGEYVRHPGD